jgi:hypothetical protein
MKRRQILLGGWMTVLALLSGTASASLGKSYPKRDVTGKVVEIDKRRGIIVLADFQGWDREQMKLARAVSKSALQRWLDGIDAKHAALFLKREDAARLRKGDRIRIPGYSYAFAGYGNGAGADVLPLYQKLEILPKGK